MNQPTPVSPTLPAPESTVVAAQMKARREELKRLLASPNSPQTGDSGQSRDTYDPRHQERRGNAVGFNGDSRTPQDTDFAQHPQPKSGAPNAVASVLSVIGEGLLQGWWHAHPARAVAQVATSLLSDQARLHPKRLILAGAVFGSAVVLIKPWRRLNVGKMLLTAVAGGGTGLVAKLLGVASATQSKDSGTRN